MSREQKIKTFQVRHPVHTRRCICPKSAWRGRQKNLLVFGEMAEPATNSERTWTRTHKKAQREQRSQSGAATPCLSHVGNHRKASPICKCDDEAYNWPRETTGAVRWESHSVQDSTSFMDLGQCAQNKISDFMCLRNILSDSMLLYVEIDGSFAKLHNPTENCPNCLQVCIKDPSRCMHQDEWMICGIMNEILDVWSHPIVFTFYLAGVEPLFLWFLPWRLLYFELALKQNMGWNNFDRWIFFILLYLFVLAFRNNVIYES